MNKKPTPQENKKYTAEFKSEAIKLAERLSVAEAAEKLGIYASQIYSWRSALNNSNTGVEREPLLTAENARLKRQLAEQAKELEILKKAATYFREASKIKRYEFLLAYCVLFSISIMARVLSVSRRRPSYSRLPLIAIMLCLSHPICW